MRNILITLTLCVLTLTTSNVFAEGYDESKRTERLGLSFYDGRPMFLLRISYLYPNATVTDPRLEVVRLKTGDVLENDERYYAYYGYLSYSADGRRHIVAYGYDADGNLEPLTVNKGLSSSWCVELINEQGPGLLDLASSGDIGVSVFDAISERSRPWLLPALGVALAFFGVRYCYRLLVRMIQGESGVGFGVANNLSVSVNRGDDSFFGDYARTSSVATSDNAWENADVSNADEYATGEALGQEFTPKVVALNVDLQNEWSRLSESERAELLGDDFGGAPFGGRAYPRRQGNYYVDLERDNYYVDLTDEDER